MAYPRNKPCWCGSGLKYKKCHLGRERQERPNAFQIAAEQLKLFKRPRCLHPSAPAECKGGIVRAHTVRRRGDLTTIARDGHVYHGNADLKVLRQTGGRIQAQLIGIKKASTFLGFCGFHDVHTFAPLETEPFAATERQCFLLAYRALAREHYMKAAHIDSIPLYREFDPGLSSPQQALIQGAVQAMLAASKESLSNLIYHKRLYDADLLASAYSAMRFLVLHLDRAPSIVAGGMTQPKYDFEGRLLQDMGVLGVDRWDLISFSLIATEAGGAGVFSWRENSDSCCQALIDSFLQIPYDRQADALLRFIFENFENAYISPDWWERLPSAIRFSLEERMSHGASPLYPTEPSCLLDDGVRAADWRVVRTTAKLN